MRRGRDAETQRLRAEQRERQATAVAEFLRDTLDNIEPGYGRQAGFEDLLQEVAEKLDNGLLRHAPSLEAELRIKLGNACEELGLMADAEIHRRESLRLLRQSAGEEAESTLYAAFELAELLLEQLRFQDAEEIVTHSLAIQQRILPDDDPARLRMEKTLAAVYSGQGRFNECEALLRDVVQRSRRARGEEDQDTLMALHGLGRTLLDQRRFVESEEIFRHLVDTRRRLFGESDRYLSGQMRSLVQVLVEQQKSAEAVPIATEAVRLAEAVHGQRSKAARSALFWAAKAHAAHNDLAQAEDLYRQLLEASPDQNPRGRASILFEIAYLQRRQGHFVQAVEAFQETLELQQAHSERAVYVGMTALGLGRTLLDLKRHDESETVLLDAHRAFAENNPPHPDAFVAARYLSRLYEEAGRLEESQRWSQIAASPRD